MRLFGLQVPGQLPQVIDRVGAIVEEPRFVPTFSGRKNLLLLARSIGLPRSARRRRAAAGEPPRPGTGQLPRLLPGHEATPRDRGRPAQEPGPADPRRAHQRPRPVRASAASATSCVTSGESGVTVLLSSHNLAEVQQVCHSVSIIGERLACSRRVRSTGCWARRSRALWSASATRAQPSTSWRSPATRSPADGEQLVVEGHEHPAEITRLLAERGLYVEELTAIRPTLESFFLKLTGRHPHRPTPPGRRPTPGTTAAPRRGRGA